MSETWRSIAARKQEERSGKIPSAWRLKASDVDPNASAVLDTVRRSGILSERELELTEIYDARTLRDQLARGSIKSEEVVLAFCKRAAIAQQVTNCLTEIFSDDALARARELDAHLAKTGKPLGPLHGLPISLKDTFKVKGYDASIGIASLCFQPATSNSALVDILLKLGAVLYVKTTVPQTMMSLDTYSNVFGRTLNPANKRLTAGIGTDVGGSVRVPAACNGLYGVKPSHGRVPYANQQGGSAEGSSKLAIESTAGPIATTLGDCEMLLQAIADAAPEMIDPDCVAQPWALQPPLNTKPGKPLRVGLVASDGHVLPLPPVQNLMREVSKTLGTSQRIEVVQLDLTLLLSRTVKVFNGLISIDGANNWFDLFEPTGEPLQPWLQGRLKKRPRKELLAVKSLQCQKLELQTAFLDVWKESGGHWVSDGGNTSDEDRVLDVLICPVAPHPIAPIDQWNTVNYTAAFNLLDLPAGVLPVRSVAEKDLSGELPASKPLNGWDDTNRKLWTDVDRKVYLGSPLSVQVVSPRLTERRLVEAMMVIDEALKPLQEKASGVNSRL
ncbi:unnamed protein product [Zymoseptoria tritici ST99CH_3D1]|nr:unnamed protein product [Zymoseptoria tritici ST99CH_3D1]